MQDMIVKNTKLGSVKKPTELFTTFPEDFFAWQGQQNIDQNPVNQHIFNYVHPPGTPSRSCLFAACKNLRAFQGWAGWTVVGKSCGGTQVRTLQDLRTSAIEMCTSY